MIAAVLLAWLAVFVLHAVYVMVDVARESRERQRGGVLQDWSGS